MHQLKDVKTIIKRLNEHGYEAYIVGGFVRDYLLNQKNGDIDIATNALPETVKSIFPKTILTGVKHGTVTVIFQDEQYEITTFRKESHYLKNRKPESVFFVSSLKEDVKRRDFTMNALALTIDEKIIDYVDGITDIEDKTIRTVGNPYERFSEDALRMLRAFRFVSTLGFKIEKESLIAITNHKELIKNISDERILKEFENMMNQKYFVQAIELMIKTDFHHALPILKNGIEMIHKTKIVPVDLFEFLTICAVCGNFQQIKTLPISNKLKKEMGIVYDMFMLGITDFTKPIIFRNGLRNCIFTNKLNVYLKQTEDKKEDIIKQYKQMPIHKPCDLSFRGDDILKLYDRKPGGWISDLIDEICLKVLNDELPNDKVKIKEYLHNLEKKDKRSE